MNLDNLAIQTIKIDSLEIWQKHFQMTRRRILKGHGNGIVSKITFWITTCLLSSYESIRLDEVFSLLLVSYVSTYFFRLFLFWPSSKLKRHIYSFMIVLSYKSRFSRNTTTLQYSTLPILFIGVYSLPKTPAYELLAVNFNRKQALWYWNILNTMQEINLSPQVSVFILRYKWVDILQIRLKTLF